ncbi:MAG: hypothetical protein AAGA96_18250 [Verrucomicrobiota bacterium]
MIKKNGLIGVLAVALVADIAIGQELDLRIPDIDGGLDERGSVARRAGKVEIHTAFQPGLTYRFVTRNEIRAQFPVHGSREVITEQQARLDSGFRNDGGPGMALQATTERLKMEIRSSEHSIQYDSLEAADRKSELGRHLNSALTRRLELIVSNSNEVVSSIQKGREASSAPIEGVPQFGGDELVHLVEILLQAMPKEKVWPGERWTIQGNRQFAESGKMGFDITCRFRGEVRHEQSSFLQIDLTGTASGSIPSALPNESEAIEEKMIPFEVPSISGRILYDPLQKMVHLLDCTVIMKVEASGAEGVGGVLVPVQQRTTVELLHIIPTP